MLKLILALATFATAVSASALGTEVTSRFDILKNPSTNPNQLYFLDSIGTNTEDAESYFEAMEWLKSEKWNAGLTDLCFNSAGPTMEINMCAYNQLLFVKGTIAGKFQQLKKDVRGSDELKKSIDPIVAVKFVQNAAIAQGRIVEDLCQADSMGWWGGTGKSAIYIGCQSKFLGETDDFEVLSVFVNYKPVENYNEEQALDYVGDSAWVVEKTRQQLKDTVDAGDTSFEEGQLMDADKALNEEYAATKKYYEDNYNTEDYLNENGQLLSVVALDYLKKFERSWIQYRDAYCQAYSVLLFPGAQDQKTYGGLARVNCLTEQTYKQTARLKAVDRE